MPRGRIMGVLWVAGGWLLFFFPAKSKHLQLVLGSEEKYWLYKKKGCQVSKSCRKRKSSEMGVERGPENWSQKADVGSAGRSEAVAQ